MAIPNWIDCYEMDVTEYIRENKEQKDKNGKHIEYIPWNLCLVGLHKIGAEKVRFIPLYNKENEHSVFTYQNGAMIDKDPNGKRAKDPFSPEVHVRVIVDDLEDDFSYPVINGLEVVTMNKINQQLVNSARQRAFVKGVAIMTGFGLKLWEKEEVEAGASEDLGIHNIFSVQKRIERQLTDKLAKGMTSKEIYAALGTTETKFRTFMAMFKRADEIEKALQKI